MKPTNKTTIAPAKGRLALLTPGMGAVATTLYAGVEAVKRGLAQPIGSVTQMGRIRLGKRTEGRSPRSRGAASARARRRPPVPPACRRSTRRCGKRDAVWGCGWWRATLRSGWRGSTPARPPLRWTPW